MSKTSSKVKNAWNAKTYKQFTISLRKDTDEDVIEILEDARERKELTALIREAVRSLPKKDRKV